MNQTTYFTIEERRATLIEEAVASLKQLEVNLEILNQNLQTVNLINDQNGKVAEAWRELQDWCLTNCKEAFCTTNNNNL